MERSMKREKNIVDSLIMWWQYEQGDTIRALAKAIGITEATLYYWTKKSGGVVPMRHLKKINEITGGVFSPMKMRPDLFPT